MEIKEAIYAVRSVYVSKCNAPCTMRQLAQKITVRPENVWQKRRFSTKNIIGMIFRQDIGEERINKNSWGNNTFRNLWAFAHCYIKNKEAKQLAEFNPSI